jgi:hypothetical protein
MERQVVEEAAGLALRIASAIVDEDGTQRRPPQGVW